MSKLYKTSRSLVPIERIHSAILFFRGQKVMLDADLDALYGVSTKVLLQAVKRNAERFPADFMFRLTAAEAKNLRSQFVTSSWGGRRNLPCAFTQEGVAMLSSVVRSPRAVQINIEIMRAFVRLRDVLATHRNLARKLAAMKAECDGEFHKIWQVIRQLIAPPDPPRRKIGFIAEAKGKYHVKPRK